MQTEESDPGGSFWGNAILTVIAVGFVVGLFPLVSMTFKPIVNAIAASKWETGEAVVISSYVDARHRQYKLNSRYRYNWQDVEYVSNRVFFDDTVGIRRAYYHQINRELLKHTDENNPLQIWVDPEQPEQAVIYRHVRWDKFAGNLLFLAIWTLITIGLVVALLISLPAWIKPRRRSR